MLRDKEIYKTIKNALADDQEKFGEIRKKVYHGAFGDSKHLIQLKKEIEEAYA